MTVQRNRAAGSASSRNHLSGGALPVVRHLLGLLLVAGGASMAPVGRANAQSEIVGWGRFRFDSAWNQGPFARVRAGWIHSMAIRADGSAVAWGINWNQMCEVPALPAGVTYIDIEAEGTCHRAAQ
jgi:hypothetical protein